MKSSSNFKLLFAFLGMIFVLSTGINLHAFSGIEDGIIRFSWSNNGFFSVIDQAKIITIATNLVGLTIITFMWRRSLRRSNEQS